MYLAILGFYAQTNVAVASTSSPHVNLRSTELAKTAAVLSSVNFTEQSISATLWSHAAWRVAWENSSVKLWNTFAHILDQNALREVHRRIPCSSQQRLRT